MLTNFGYEQDLAPVLVDRPRAMVGISFFLISMPVTVSVKSPNDTLDTVTWRFAMVVDPHK